MIEDEYDTVGYTPSVLDLKSILINSDENKHNQYIKKINRICHIFIRCIIIMPFIVGDIYFALTPSDTCRRYNLNKLPININISLYLLISGLWGIVILISYSLVKYYINREHFDDDNRLLLYISYSNWFSKLLSIIMVIVGYIMYFSLNPNDCTIERPVAEGSGEQINSGDDSLRSSSIYHYLLASMIVKSLLIIVNLVYDSTCKKHFINCSSYTEQSV
jgi:hypothetical protein